MVKRISTVCKGWHAIVKDDELWRQRCGLSELPSGCSNWFSYAQRQTIREQALDHLYGRAGVTQNWRQGLQLLSVLADAGDDYAMALYGWALCHGVGVTQERSRGELLLQQSTHIIARAFCLLYETVVTSDNNEAYRLLTTECDTSDPHVQYLLGLCLLRGIASIIDYAGSVRCFKRAGNHVGAVCQRGDAFLHGRGRDYVRAVQLLRQAAEQGYDWAQSLLGRMYRFGRGVPKDLEQAKHWEQMS